MLPVLLIVASLMVGHAASDVPPCGSPCGSLVRRVRKRDQRTHAPVCALHFRALPTEFCAVSSQFCLSVCCVVSGFARVGSGWEADQEVEAAPELHVATALHPRAGLRDRPSAMAGESTALPFVSTRTLNASVQSNKVGTCGGA
eukprot:3442622-Prymnesium_polylepis.1